MEVLDDFINLFGKEAIVKICDPLVLLFQQTEKYQVQHRKGNWVNMAV